MEEALRKLNAKGVVPTKQAFGTKSKVGTQRATHTPHASTHCTRMNGARRQVIVWPLCACSQAGTQHSEAMNAFKQQGGDIDVSTGFLKKSTIDTGKRRRAKRPEANAPSAFREHGAPLKPWHGASLKPLQYARAATGKRSTKPTIEREAGAATQRQLAMAALQGGAPAVGGGS